MAYSQSLSTDLKPSVGIGLRHQHFDDILETLPDIAWLEVHSENFFAKGGHSLDVLSQIIKHYPLSLHGVNLSLGSADGIDDLHLDRLKELVEWTNPFLISEHLSWGRIGPNYANDLLPVPYHDDVLDVFLKNIDKVQEKLGRNILIENPSSYLAFKDSTYHEADFLNKICTLSGAGMLLDVNNIFVSCSNHDWDLQDYLGRVDVKHVQEIHLAGHSVKNIDGEEFRIDDHSTHVCDEVWAIYDQILSKAGAIHSLIEWDTEIPALSVLIAEARIADKHLQKHRTTSMDRNAA